MTENALQGPSGIIERARNCVKRQLAVCMLYWYFRSTAGVLMNPERRGLILVVVVLGVSAILGGVYGPSVRATTASTDDYQSSVRDFIQVLDIVQSNYAEQVGIDKAVYQAANAGMLRQLDLHLNFLDSRR